MTADLETLATGWPWPLMGEECGTAYLPLPVSPVPAAPSLPLVEELPGELQPLEVLERFQGLKHVLFLDSARPHAELARYSFIAADPFTWMSARGRRVTINGELCADADPLRLLDEHLRRYRCEPVADLPPFQGGAAGLFGYDLCHHLERLPRPEIDEFEVPDLAVGFYDWVIAFDHVARRSWLISTGFPETERSRRRRAEQRLKEVMARLRGSLRGLTSPAQAMAVSPARAFPVPGLTNVFSNFERESYLAAVRRAIEYIHAGDCYQVNLAQRLLHPATLPPLELYRRLRDCNPAPFAGYFDLGNFAIASASPERFLCMRDRVIETRPIKGTRPRAATAADDHALADELLDSAKDRAENIMIVDLLRNDLGRVCRYGSVRVPALCRLESYEYVHHLVSEVRGELRDGLTGIDLLRASFPGGSVTGAPKIRAMEIITELERTARGPYCGSLGYLGFDGTMDTSILIRTFTIGRGWLQFPVGGGIVADSIPEREYEETWHKAEGMLRALASSGR